MIWSSLAVAFILTFVTMLALLSICALSLFVASQILTVRLLSKADGEEGFSFKKIFSKPEGKAVVPDDRTEAFMQGAVDEVDIYHDEPLI